MQEKNGLITVNPVFGLCSGYDILNHSPIWQHRGKSNGNTTLFNYYLLAVLASEFGLQGNLNRDKKYWRIRLFQPSAQKLALLIKPLMPTYMHYKLPL